jgi:hypothetical protein
MIPDRPLTAGRDFMETDMDRQRWQDWLLALIGLYVFLSPYIIPYFYPASTASSVVIWSHYLAGSAICVVSVAALSSNQLWEEWVDLALGVWLVVSPWVLSYDHMKVLTWNAVLTGAVVVILSASVLLSSRRTLRVT